MIEHDALQLLIETAQACREVDFKQTSAEPGHVYFICRPGEEPQRMEAAPKPRAYTAKRLVDVADMVRHFHARSTDGTRDNGEQKRPADGGVFVLCGAGTVAVVLGEERERRERITFSVPESLPFRKLVALSSPDASKPMSQADFIQHLRVDLAGCVPDEFMAKVRSLKIKGSSEYDGQVQSGRQSLDRSVLQEVAGGSFPEEVVLDVAVYEDLVDGKNVLFKTPVKCVVDLSLTNATLRLIPLGDSIAAARRAAAEFIHTSLVDLGTLEGVKVFCGGAGV